MKEITDIYKKFNFLYQNCNCVGDRQPEYVVV